MEKNQYELCTSVLARLDQAGILNGVVIIGSWCMALHACGKSIRIRAVFADLPGKWKDQITRAIDITGETEVSALLMP